MPSARTPSTTAARVPAQRRRQPVPAVPLGSLTQREHRPEETCRSCGSSRLTRLAMALTDGTPVRFSSCHDCQHRTWERQDGEVPLDAVLEHTRKR